jgi:hypothetical protein
MVTYFTGATPLENIFWLSDISSMLIIYGMKVIDEKAIDEIFSRYPEVSDFDKNNLRLYAGFMNR